MDLINFEQMVLCIYFCICMALGLFYILEVLIIRWLPVLIVCLLLYLFSVLMLNTFYRIANETIIRPVLTLFKCEVSYLCVAHWIVNFEKKILIVSLSG